jgi:hypothetical protein
MHAALLHFCQGEAFATDPGSVLLGDFREGKGQLHGLT